MARQQTVQTFARRSTTTSGLTTIKALGPAVGQPLPKSFEFTIEFIAYSPRPPTVSVVCDFDLRAVSDDDALIEFRELFRYATLKVPDAISARQVVGHF